MVFTLLGFGLLIMLAIAMLPVPRVRRMLLIGSARLMQAIVLAFLGACGTFFVHPEAAPIWVRNILDPIVEGTQSFLPSAAAAMPGLSWLVLAVLSGRTDTACLDRYRVGGWPIVPVGPGAIAAEGDADCRRVVRPPAGAAGRRRSLSFFTRQ